MKDEELWLIWRSDNESERSRYRIGVLVRNEFGDYIFRYDNSEDFKNAKKRGFSYFPGFEDTTKEYTSNNGLFSNISSRLPKTERDDYLDVLNRCDLNPEDDEFKVLMATKGRQITDNFEFVPKFDAGRIEFDIAGVGHRDADEIKKSVENGFLVDGAKLILSPEENNQFDKFAIKILLPTGAKDVFLGYVPRYYSRELSEILKQKIRYSAIVAKINLGSELRDEKISAAVRLMFSEK